MLLLSDTESMELGEPRIDIELTLKNPSLVYIG